VQGSWLRALHGALLALRALSYAQQVLFIYSGAAPSLAHRILGVQIHTTTSTGTSSSSSSANSIGPRASQLFLETRKLVWLRILVGYIVSIYINSSPAIYLYI
jgi:hypothetical protein